MDFRLFGRAGCAHCRGDGGAEESDGRGIGLGAHHFAPRATAETGLARKVHNILKELHVKVEHHTNFNHCTTKMNVM